MRKHLLTLLTCLSTLIATAQSKKNLSISFATGVFNSPYYTNADARLFYSPEFYYKLDSHHILSTGFMGGTHLLYDNERSNNAIPLTPPGYGNNTNAEADYYTWFILYKYRLFQYKQLTITPGIGD